MTADERLALIRLKIQRADKHIDDLGVLLHSFLSSSPYTIATRRNTTTRQLIYHISKADQVPIGIALVAGDILHCLRDALDHLAQQLYLVGTSGSAGYRDQTSFPISRSAKDFKSGLAGKAQGMRQDAVDAICALEPYKGGKGHDLWNFNRLNNIDKHRLIVTVGSTFRSMDIGPVAAQMFTSTFPDIELPSMTAFLRPADNKFPLKAGDELFIDAADAEPNGKIQFRFEVALNEPGIIEGKPVQETLVQFRDRVSSIVNSFRHHLA